MRMPRTTTILQAHEKFSYGRARCECFTLRSFSEGGPRNAILLQAQYLFYPLRFFFRNLSLVFARMGGGPAINRLFLIEV